MSIDGANLGIRATDAVKAVMGDDVPTEEKRLSKSEMLARVLTAPEQYADVPKEPGDASYEAGCLWLARQFYLLRKEGKDGDYDEMYQHMKARCGNADYDFTGFMVGYANNLSLWLLEKPEQENPAIMTFDS